jgi:catechol 2,3-dioxygenase-like lactoylglutathione lyase family enzyme
MAADDVGAATGRLGHDQADRALAGFVGRHGAGAATDGQEREEGGAQQAGPAAGSKGQGHGVVSGAARLVPGWYLVGSHRTPLAGDPPMSRMPSLAFSHVGVFVKDIERMVDFYTRVMGFVASDRGVLDNGAKIAFMTRNPREHHQVVFAEGCPPDASFDRVQQFSFRAECLEDLRSMRTRVQAEGLVMDGPTLGTLTHGNAISFYFRDPEGHRTEIFIDTPWYVHQPMRIPYDLSLPDAEIWAFVERHARSLSGFRPIGEWHAEMDARVAAAGGTAR